MNFKDMSLVLMYAVTPVHAGSGSSLETVDLPIQREKHTGWPVIHSSGIKGAFRSTFAYQGTNLTIVDNIFGSAAKEGSFAYAGAASFSDAKILAFPMRSSASPFVHITCPAVLKRLARDLKLKGEIFEMPQTPRRGEALILKGDFKENDEVVLEDVEVKIAPSTVTATEYFKECEQLLLVEDDIFKYAVTECTQITAQIAIDSDKGTTKEGSLRYHEELPADTLMYCLVRWSDTLNKEKSYSAAEVANLTKKVIGGHIQVGGYETMGRGIFELCWRWE